MTSEELIERMKARIVANANYDGAPSDSAHKGWLDEQEFQHQILETLVALKAENTTLKVQLAPPAKTAIEFLVDLGYGISDARDAVGLKDIYWRGSPINFGVSVAALESFARKCGWNEELL